MPRFKKEKKKTQFKLDLFYVATMPKNREGCWFQDKHIEGVALRCAAINRDTKQAALSHVVYKTTVGGEIRMKSPLEYLNDEQYMWYDMAHLRKATNGEILLRTKDDFKAIFGPTVAKTAAAEEKPHWIPAPPPYHGPTVSSPDLSADTVNLDPTGIIASDSQGAPTITTSGQLSTNGTSELELVEKEAPMNDARTTAEGALAGAVSKTYDLAAEKVAHQVAEIEINQAALIPGMMVWHRFQHYCGILHQKADDGTWTVELKNGDRKIKVSPGMLWPHKPGVINRAWSKISNWGYGISIFFVGLTVLLAALASGMITRVVDSAFFHNFKSGFGKALFITCLLLTEVFIFGAIIYGGIYQLKQVM